jgi:hypothetical protein
MSARRIVLALAVLILLAAAWSGLSGGLGQFPQSHTAGQMAQSIAQFGFGFFALLSVVTAVERRAWARWMNGCWVVFVTVAGGLAPVVWGGASRAAGAIAAVASLLIGLGIIWMLRWGAQRPSGP